MTLQASQHHPDAAAPGRPHSRPWTRRRHRLAAVCLAGLTLVPAARALRTPAFSLEHDFNHVATMAVEPPPTIHRRWFGPVYEYAAWEDGRTFLALRPFFSRVTLPDVERSQMDGLWPLASWRESGVMHSGRILLAFFQNANSDDPQSPSRTWILPFFFAGRSRAGKPYTALFPVGGRIYDFFRRDEVRFVFFPLYAESYRGETRTVHIVWPVYAASRGGGIARWRVFPFYGRARERDGTARRFVLWPLWSSMRRDASSGGGGGFVLFPLFGVVRTPTQQSTLFLPPLIRHSVTPTGTETYFPWPFYQRSTGAIEKTYLWPLWGRKSSGPVSSAFFLWPLGRLGRQNRDDHIATQRSFYPLYYSRRIDRPDDPAIADAPFPHRGRPVRRYEKIWPLYAYQRDEHMAVFRAPDLWPGRPFVPIERNIAPFWTLYSRTRTDAGREQDLLWGLFRRRVNADGGARQTRLFPLVAWERDPAADRRAVSVLLGLLRFGRENGRPFGSFLNRWHWGRQPEVPEP